MKKLKLILGTLIISLIMGVISAIFLNSLKFAENMREIFPYIIILIPIVGVLTTYVYSKYGKNSNRGNNLIIESVHRETEVPLRMSVLTFIFTILTHLSGDQQVEKGQQYK